MARNIGIVGAGIAGLHLALYLQKHGVDATVITDRPPEDYRDIRLLNTVAHHHVTIAREDYLGVNHWSDPKDHYYYHDHVFNFPQPLSFRGEFSKPSRAVDYRIYLPALMQDFMKRGGRIEYRRIEERDIRPLVARFDLLVVSTGKGPLGQLFTYRPEHTPYQQPQRRLCVGLYTGVRQPDPMNVTLSVSPGHGEMIVIPTITFGGVANALLMENVPGGDMEELATLSYDDNPKHFLKVLLGKLEKHHPTTYDRIDTARFDLAQPQDLLQGGVVPTVRNTVVEFDDGKCAIALGDVHAIVDPMMGQGANVASYAAFVLGEEIVNADALDVRLCEKIELKRQDRVLAASRWTNVMLQPPTEALGMLIGAMSQNPALANEFTENFNYPDRQWDRICTPQRIQAWIERMSAPPEPVRAIA
ncbi:styrene monooxygenase subunit StyA [Bradyrhizobium japonicum]|uniref:styrene monooxygenase subunit StyA n=1 Tax=Bradyrhizobium japonicum TaxID=375 RepID=UPI00209FB7D2|nr:styrene monooxygenase/indole monooxygenase family protein [Bradyrhizobium japonicum]MCP1762180.1 2-polyprenyl-6-methoxyphenol hydroxylase-like FAD-dependent oxidoreductase [Bradyrhizobium japonicum]MCP1793760.1 2-polyprenyl-6-methoxyphenol hydroxylase-like FAD-dependent oxidoreductase [Bradyrhizobium japonicum]MCP1806193.1 2-polyprenyl-6-methoxyphenol hydroxylase-like FAD-dependent oxidoreductase [Bradyrhizobium japonicum]MCP1815121.1 2-polyprenyl-6-methoxyphenol hydroxylase-like FAD-depende